MQDKKEKSIGLIGTLVFHGVIILLLIFFGFTKVEEQEEEGVLVMIGDNITMATGSSSNVTEMPVVESQPEPQSEFQSSPDVNEEIVTQDIEESLQLEEVDKKAKEEAEKKKKLEDEKRKAEELKRKQEEEKKRQEDAIKNRVANVFQNSSQQGTAGTSNEGDVSQGSLNGNSNTGAVSGSPGYGSYDLGGRAIKGTLPRPQFSVNESGVVVVNITVDEKGSVINTIIGRGTTTSSEQLRNSAIQAARKAKFDPKEGTPTQSGTITYKFDSDN